MKAFFTSLFCAIVILNNAQVLTHGPIVGGVTDTSCNIFVRTSQATGFTILLSNTVPFSNIAASAAGTTNAALDTTAIVHIGGLTPNTAYSMRVTINGVPQDVPAKFTTMYTAGTTGHQVFVTGANINSLTDADSLIFNRAAAENARAFLSLGNWGYPDGNGCIDIYLTSPPSSWAKTYTNVQALYKQRYSSRNSLSFIQNQAVDFVYDDHDYMNEKSGKSLATGYIINPFSGFFGAPATWTQPAQARANAIQGYETYFPAYNLPDTANGIYHSFRSGNAEFFVIDTRSARGYELNGVDTQGSTTHWVYDMDTVNHMLGNDQMRWLKNSLAASTATWKFIVSSVPFNMGMHFALDTLIKLGNTNVPYWNPKITCNPLLVLGSHAFSSTIHFSDMWAGYKADAADLLSFVTGNNIANVYVLSGNTGTAGLDDGANSGLPELMSGNMKITNTQDALLCQQFLGFNIWDMGGSSLCQQQNDNYTYGRVEIFNDDSIRLSAVDQNGAEVAGGNFYANAVYKYNPNYLPNRIPYAVNDVVSIEQDSTVTINILANDSDLNNYPLFANLQTNATHGTATLNGNNTVTYVPDSGYYGVDTFRYLACDHTNPACNNCAQALVTINISHVNGINTLQNNPDIKVYPNPAVDAVFVTGTANTGAYNFVLISEMGQKIAQMGFTGNGVLDVSKYAAGNYYYQVFDKEGQMVKVGKLAIFK